MKSRRIILLYTALAFELGLVVAWNFLDDWTIEFTPVKFAAAGMLAGIAFFAAASLFSSKSEGRACVAIFWGMAVLLRVAAVPLTPGDDLWRYEWEGKIQQAGWNPYVAAPDDPKLEPLRELFPSWSKINHREYSAIYPPGAELLFAAIHRLTESTLFYKLFFAAADLGVVGVLLALVRLEGNGKAYQVAAWYAWNPLVVYSFAGAAHFDSLMILAMLGGIYFLVKASVREGTASEKWLHATIAASCFGVAISLKLVPILLLPLCAVALGARAITLVLSMGLPAALSLCYGWPQIPIWKSLGRFAHVTRLNDLFWWLVEGTFWPNPWQKNDRYKLITMAVMALVSLLWVRNWRRGMLWVMGAALILSPVMHPWYCTWILPLAAWRRAHAWQVLSITLFAYFLFWDERLFLLPWHADPWMRAIIIAPPLAASVLRIPRQRAANA